MNTSPRLDFDAIAAAALAAADRLVAQWLQGGKRVGHEWQCGSLAGEAGSSCSINLNTGRWADFASDDRGSDLIALYAAIFNVKQGVAAREISAQLGMTEARPAPTPSRPPPLAKPAAPAATPTWIDAGAWPGTPEAPRAHEFRGRPAARWDYTDAAGALLGSVCRFETSDGGKEIIPLVWSQSTAKGLTGWRWRQFDEARPLWQWHELAKPGDDRLIVVPEGEKCAELAQQVSGAGYVFTTWPGGCKAWPKANWAILAGRRVVIWPDADAKFNKDGTVLLDEAQQPGMRAAEGIAATLIALGCDVRIVNIPRPGERPDGWDVADLIAECGDNAAEQVRAWVSPARTRLPRTERPATPAQAAAAPTPVSAARADGEAREAWRDAMLFKRGELLSHLTNIALILRHDSRWTGVAVFDEFQQRVTKAAPPPFPFARVGEWDAEDDSRTVDWLAQRWGMNTSSAVVAEAVEMVARERPVHPVRDWLKGLKWDGTKRLPSWLEDFCGVPRTPYSERVAGYFVMGMVARVFQPGCKFDYCLVLEGPQGIGKSTLMRVLGGEHYSDTELDLAHKDSMAALRGKWLHEFSEMDSITKAESPKQKSFLSRQVDEFRPVYARREIKLPRQVCFAGTTNEDEWARDSTGARRFWPIACLHQIDTEGLALVREQLFAEAVHYFLAGGQYHPSPEEQRRYFSPEQARRVVQESLVDALHDYVFAPSYDEVSKRAPHGGLFSNACACMRGLHLSAAQITRDMQTRVGKALSQLGCERVEKRNGMTRYWYKAPQKAAQLTNDPQPAQLSQGGGDADLPV